MKKHAIIVAGGSGMRAGGDIPKQFQSVGGKAMLLWSIDAFRKEDPETEIILVVHPDFIDLAEEMLQEAGISDVRLAKGGHSRWASVKNGLSLIEPLPMSMIAVHDAARPLLSRALVKRGWEECMCEDAAIPVVNVTDSLREKLESGESKPVDRSRFLAVQTPQVFNAELLAKAYEQPERHSFTDDASVVEAFGHKVECFLGDVENIKVTHPADFLIAETILKSRTIKCSNSAR